MINYYPDFFNDVFGPIMQPGSSSHTAAPCRLGLLARALLGENPIAAEFIMDKDGSFAGTFGVMDEDKGMLAGILGIWPEDERISSVYELARKNGICYRFIFDSMKESDHLNAIKIVLKGESGKTAQLVGESTGGGMIRVRKVNGFDIHLIGDTYVMLIFAELTHLEEKLLANSLEGYIEAQILRCEDSTLYCIKTSCLPDSSKIKNAFPDIPIEILPPVLPVVMHKDRKPQLFKSMEEWRSRAIACGNSMSAAAMQYEVNSSLWSKEQVGTYMHKIKEVLYRQITAAYEENSAPRNPFYRYDGEMWDEYQHKNRILSGNLMGEVVKRAIGVISKTRGVPMVPGPMGTGGGYLFSAVYSVKEAYGFSDDDLIRGLFVAAGIGAIAYTHTNPTGEVVGCAGECGVCCAMASAAIVEMAGGNGEDIENAASLALQAFFGLPCDPVIGGYEAPCFSRAISAASMSVIFADLALAGSKAVIPYDELLVALDNLGKSMSSELLCTSKGGACTTPTAKSCELKFREWFDNRNKILT
ncbi:L-serine ammonia-lyase, iron-sulfur-dependent, subunit alpha [Bacillota bacterium LX-D]|nr:L-serine ammonia-lyase, iron-sulfur-dependent, subunit alpha [Bacillota bacterium LX-D]